MNDKQNFAATSRSMAEPVRARILCRLMGDHARTAAELAVVEASTASAHLARLSSAGLQRLLGVTLHAS